MSIKKFETKDNSNKENEENNPHSYWINPVIECSVNGEKVEIHLPGVNLDKIRVKKKSKNKEYNNYVRCFNAVLQALQNKKEELEPNTGVTLEGFQLELYHSFNEPEDDNDNDDIEVPAI